MPLQCAQIVLDRGHQINGIISSDDAVQDWAQAHQIPRFHPSADLAAVLRREPFDYLFSIFNALILREEILSLPRAQGITLGTKASIQRRKS